MDSWIYDSENQGRGQRSIYKFKSYQYLLTFQYVIGGGPEREEDQGAGTIQNLGV